MGFDPSFEIYLIRIRMRLVALLGSASLAIGLAAFAGGYAIWGAKHQDLGSTIRVLGDTRITLQQGLAASEQEGQPISGKFEIDDGELQLLVYTAKDGSFFKVLVDDVTAGISKVEPVTDGHDLAVTDTEGVAMAKATSPLRRAVEAAMDRAEGFRAISVVPDLRDGAPVTSVLLFKAGQLRTVSEALD
jgi:hypothetical protein